MTDKNNSLACRKRRTTAEISINYTQQKCYNIWIRLQRRVILRNGTNGKCKLSSPLEFQYDKYMNAGPNNWFTFSWLVFKQTNHREVKHSNKSKPAWLGNVCSFCSCFSSRTEGKFPSRARAKILYFSMFSWELHRMEIAVRITEITVIFSDLKMQ